MSTFTPTENYLSYENFCIERLQANQAIYLSEEIRKKIYTNFCHYTLHLIDLGTAPKDGLCVEFNNYIDRNYKLDNRQRIGILNYQTYLFKLHGLSAYFPFNEIEAATMSAAAHAYDTEKKNGKLYQNPKRLAWLQQFASPQS